MTANACGTRPDLPPVDPTVDLSLTMSAVVRADDGAFTWTTRNADGDTTRYCTNTEGDGIYYEAQPEDEQEDGWLQLMAPVEFVLHACSTATRRRRIVGLLTDQGFEVTTGHVTPDEMHPVPRW